MAESTVKVVFLGDASKLKRELDDIDGSTSKAEGGFGKLATAIGGAVAVGSVVSLGKGAFDAAIESQKIAAQTEAVIKSTGGAAQVTAKQVSDLASSLSKKNGVDDEAIQKGQNLLLTFTNVQNKAGEGNDIFDQSTQVMVDMAAAMGTGVAGGAVQLGKALNNPKDGISALTRVGVTFTDQQKKQIAAMQDAGDMAGAQKIILAELTKEFGGSAAAQATSTDKMKIAFGNLQEQVGAKLIPIVERFSNWMVGVGIPALERFAGWMNENVVPAVQAMADGIGTAIAAVADWWREHWDQIRDTTETIINGVRAVIETVLGAIEAFWRTWGGNISRVVEGLFNGMRDFIDGAIKVIQGILQAVMALIHGDWGKAWDGIKLALEGVWLALQGIVETAIATVRGIVEAGMRLVAGIFDEIWSGIVGAVRGAWDEITGKVDEAAGKIQAKLYEILGFFASLGTGVAGVVKDMAATLAGWVLDVWNFGGQVLDFFREIPGKIGGFFSDLADAITAPFRAAFQAIKDLWNSTIGGFGVHIPGIGPFGGVDLTIPKMHTGGIVPGSGDVPIIAKGGEGVFTREQMAALGRGGGGQVINIAFNVGNATPQTVQQLQTMAPLFARQITVALRGAA